MFFIKNKFKFFLAVLVTFIPTVLLAAQATSGSAKLLGIPASPSNLKALICIIVFLALDFVPYIIVLAVCAFVMGLIKYIGHGDNEEKRAEGNKLMIYGIVGLFFIFSIWGILKLFTVSFGLPLGVPQFKEQSVTDGATCTRTSSGSSSNTNSSTWYSI